MIEDENLVFDGGFATQLVTNGYAIDDDPLWSARLLETNQDAILKVHESFLAAGADAILSATYQASIVGFMKELECSSSHAEKLIQDGAKLVTRACDDFYDQNRHRPGIHKPLACASLGPYGAHLGDGSEYTGSYIEAASHADLIDFHESRLSIMAKENLDLYVFETIPALEEANAILKLIEKFPNEKFVFSFSCKDSHHLCHGEKFVDAVKLVNQSKHVIAVGVNCTAPCYITSLLGSVQGLTDKKLLVMPNSGEKWEEKQWVDSDAVKKVDFFLKEWIELGINWIGGCCRISPNDISNIKKHFSKP